MQYAILSFSVHKRRNVLKNIPHTQCEEWPAVKSDQQQALKNICKTISEWSPAICVIYSKFLLVYDRIWWKTNRNLTNNLMKILTLAVGLLCLTVYSWHSASATVHVDSPKKITQMKSRIIKCNMQYISRKSPKTYQCTIHCCTFGSECLLKFSLHFATVITQLL